MALHGRSRPSLSLAVYFPRSAHYHLMVDDVGLTMTSQKPLRASNKMRPAKDTKGKHARPPRIDFVVNGRKSRFAH